MTSEVATTTGRFEVAPHRCFACGELNTVGLRLVMHVAGDTCWTETTLSPDFQGWQDITHGGIVATILDEVMGWALASADAWGFTAKLTVEFRRPTPIGRHVRAEGRLIERRRRLLTTRAQLLDAETGELLATADALYVAAPPERKQALKDRYQFRLVPEAEKAPEEFRLVPESETAPDGVRLAPEAGTAPASTLERSSRSTP